VRAFEREKRREMGRQVGQRNEHLLFRNTLRESALALVGGNDDLAQLIPNIPNEPGLILFGKHTCVRKRFDNLEL